MFWATELGLDVGTSKTTVYSRGQGVVATDVSAVALSSRTGNTLAVGKNAAAVAQSDAAEGVVVHPMSGGTIADMDAAVKLLRELIGRALGRRGLLGPNAVAAVPPGATQLERTALTQALREAGARRVVLVDASLAAALGAGIGVNQRNAKLIIDLGAGTTNIGIISGGAVLMSRSLRFGGLDLDESIRRYIRRRFRMTVTTESAERIKIRVGAVVPGLQREPVSLDGVEVYGELFKNIKVPLNDIPELLAKHVGMVAGEVRWLLEDLSAAQRQEILTGGIALAGGTAQLRGIATLFREKLGINASVVANPAECVSAGVGVVLQNPGRLRLDGCQFYPTDQ